ncbi:hypothetical protein ACVFYP_09165 [Roseomonas sp. F4]
MPDPAPRPPERPATFAERGCAVPFTAPDLTGGRLRRLPPGPAELLLPAPEGRGVVVVPWSECLGQRAASLHDRQLWDRIVGQDQPTPARIRAAAREVARLGYAGRPAQAAALAAQQRQATAKEALRAALVDIFGAQAAEGGLLGPLLAILGRTGAGPALPGGGQPLAAIPRELQALRRLCVDLAAWGHTVPAQTERRAATLALSAARMTLPKAEACLLALWEAVAALPRGQAPGSEALPRLAELASRVEWLLDGWALPGALWAAAPPDARGGVVVELVALLPILPLEAEAWPEVSRDPSTPWDTLLRARRAMPPAPPRPAGLARNEALRVLAA